MGSTITGSTIASLSDEEIARLCHVDLDKRYARRFAQISDDVFVKFGWGVTEDEAKNQEYARMLCNDTKVMVPEVYRYFTWCGFGFIVMEFVRGDRLKDISWEDHPNIIPELAEAICALATKKPADFPGPRNGGMPRGYMFSDDGAGPSLNTMDSLNSWLDRRAMLTSSEWKFNFQLTDCVFCHMDLCPRNIILRDGTLCLLDWEFAGFYPRVFEKYSILFNGQIAEGDPQFADALSNALDLQYERAGLGGSDERMIGLLDRIYRNNMKYIFDDSPDVYIDWKAMIARDRTSHRDLH